MLLIIGAVAASGFWMLDGLLGYTERIGGREAIGAIRDYRHRQHPPKE